MPKEKRHSKRGDRVKNIKGNVNEKIISKGLRIKKLTISSFLCEN
jgi:hypothetical protein